MKVRDRTCKRGEYKGRETDASESVCPCRPCFNAHDCGYEQRVYSKDGRWVSNKHIVKMECATRHNRDCPTVKPEPEHIYSSDRAKVCRRCGHRRDTSND